MTSELVNLYVSVNSTSDIDNEDIDEMARDLMQELIDLDGIGSVDLVAQKSPEGAKGPGIDFGTVLVKIVEVGGISTLITVLGTWLSRDRSRTLKLQIDDKSLEITGISKTEQADLIQWFKIQTGIRLDP